MSPPTPRELMHAIAQSQDRDAFSALFEDMAPRVKGFLMRATGGNAALSEELSQEVMVRVWKKAGSYRSDRASVNTWVFTIARNVRIDHARKKRPMIDESDPALVADTQPMADDVVAQSNRAQALRTALESLPDEQATVLHRAYFEGQTLREVSEALDVPLGTIKSRVRLALGRLQRVLVGEAS